ncbi:hypothetical protein ACUR5C_08285 [Aliikangiella sp. IMCC44653]
MKKLVTSLIATLLLSACAGQDKINKGELADVPDWILSPQIEDGIAESACVAWSGNMSIDKDEASHIARDRLAKQIDIRAAGMTKAFADKTTTSAGMNTGTTFESVSRQIFDQTLKGSKPTKAGLFTIDMKKNFCVMIEVSPEQTKALYNGIVSASGKQLNAEDDRVLFQQFKAWKAQQELDKNLEN